MVCECEVDGRSVEIDSYKRRYEKIRPTKVLSTDELKQRIKDEWNGEYDLYYAIFPVNPLDIQSRKVTDEDIELLKQWASVCSSFRDSVCSSFRASVRDSLRDAVRASVWNSVCDSVCEFVGYSVYDSMYAYISSLFPKVKNWKGIEHEKGKNPFQSTIDLWTKGLVPYFDGEIWRLHSGKDSKVVWEGSL